MSNNQSKKSVCNQISCKCMDLDGRCPNHHCWRHSSQDLEGEHETHTACNSRIKNEGGKSRCCYCVPHENCDLSKPVSEGKECEHKNTSPNVIGLADEVCNDCGSKKYMENRVPTPPSNALRSEEECNCGYEKGHSLECPLWTLGQPAITTGSTPKVATYEKGDCEVCSGVTVPIQYDGVNMICPKCFRKYEVKDTPHESEDWSESVIKLCKEMPDGAKIDHVHLVNLIRKVESKAYQRGREEGYTEGRTEAIKDMNE